MVLVYGYMHTSPIRYLDVALIAVCGSGQVRRSCVHSLVFVCSSGVGRSYKTMKAHALFGVHDIHDYDHNASSASQPKPGL